MELIPAQNYADANAKRIESSIPLVLATKEERFFEQIARSRLNPLNKLKALYLLMDELNSYVSNFAPCKRGCSGCCHYKVAISELEISYIEEKTKAKRNKIFKPDQNFHGIPCPFLKDHACSIYDARPFMCRRHLALTETNYWCDPIRSNDLAFTSLRFSSVNDAYKLLTGGIGPLSVDIRQVF